MNGSLVRYDAMINAIVACHSVDEVKDYRDKAMALEAYAKIAMNVEAERQACEVRLRAERRAGELFSELKRKQGGNGSNQHTRNDSGKAPSPYKTALERTGTPERTAQRYQELAAVPKDQFEESLRAPTKPSTNGILRAANGSTSRMDSGSLWLWGTLRDWERDGHLDRDQAELFGGMTETMQADVRRVAPRVIDWLTNLLRGLR